MAKTKPAVPTLGGRPVVLGRRPAVPPPVPRAKDTIYLPQANRPRPRKPGPRIA